MRIGFVINDIDTENPIYTTPRLVQAAAAREHDVFLIGVGDFIYGDNELAALGYRVEPHDPGDIEKNIETLRESEPERLSIDDLDVLMLRNDPADDAEQRPWAQTSGILFGQLAATRGTIVVNDPNHLADAINKTYFQHFPQAVRPRTCITRSADAIRDFIEDHDDTGVIKPLQGSGGRSVFLVRPEDKANLNQMIEAVTRDGYAIVQEYLPGAEEGDVRMFLMNGHPLEKDGQYAAFRRRSQSDDMRSNLSAGGEPEPAEVTEDALRLVEMVRPKLVRDGMFLVGIDIVDDKLMEVNVFSPGGIGIIQDVTGVDFTDMVIRDLERKVRFREYYGRSLSNVEIAAL